MIIPAQIPEIASNISAFSGQNNRLGMRTRTIESSSNPYILQSDRIVVIHHSEVLFVGVKAMSAGRNWYSYYIFSTPSARFLHDKTNPHPPSQLYSMHCLAKSGLDVAHPSLSIRQSKPFVKAS